LCTHPPKPDSTPCADTDNNQCTTAGCNGSGVCDQNHQVTTCPSDNNECTNDVCNPANGQCQNPPLPNSTPCPDTDHDTSTRAGCEAGVCVQTHASCNTPVLHHYMCYEMRKVPFVAIPNVTLQDHFGTEPATVARTERLCAPADKNDEDPNAPLDPVHLAGHHIKGTKVGHPGLQVFDQFHTTTPIFLDITKLDRLFVPASKDLNPNPPPPPAPTPPTIDHFKSYKVRHTPETRASKRIRGEKVDDQSGTITVDLLNPHRLCTPVNKNNEDPSAPSHPTHLLCYKTRKVLFTTALLDVTDQFGSQTL